jgi:hypothetical protein
MSQTITAKKKLSIGQDAFRDFEAYLEKIKGSSYRKRMDWIG